MKKAAVVISSGIHEADLGCVAKEAWDWSTIPTVGMGPEDQSRQDEYEFDK